MDEQLKLANRLHEVVVGNVTCVNTWGVYLFNSDFDGEPELRNKIGVIWLCALLDTVEAEMRFIPDAIREAESNGWNSLVHNGKQLQKVCKITAELLNCFTREEQMFLIDLRNQWTHGYLANRHRDRVSVKYVENGVIKAEHLPHSEYIEITRVFVEQGNLDETLRPLIDRALDQRHRYWAAIGVLRKLEKEMYRILREGETFSITV